MPGYREIAADLRSRIEAGEYAPGTVLPRIEELAETYGVARQTARSAITSLARAGLVDPVKRRGTVVLAAAPIRRLARGRFGTSGQAPFAADAEANSFTPSVQVTVEVEQADDRIAELLGLQPDAPVLVRDRVMSADGAPVQLATSYLPRHLTEGTAIEQDDTGPGGIYARLAEAGHAPTRFTETVRARPPKPEEADALRLRDGQHVLAVTRTAYAGDTPVEVNDIVLTADRFELAYDIPAG